VRQLAAAFDCQFIANLDEMSASQWRKQSFLLRIYPKYPANNPRRQQAAALHGALRAHLKKKRGIGRLAAAPSGQPVKSVESVAF
jgi:hypothetical protein